MLRQGELLALQEEFGQRKPLMNINEANKKKAEAQKAAQRVNDRLRANAGSGVLPTAEDNAELQAHLDTMAECNEHIIRHEQYRVRPGNERSFINIQREGVGHDESPDGLGAIGEWMRGKLSASDTPLHSYQSPISPGLATSIPTNVLDRISTYLQNDAFRLAGSTIYLTDNTDPLVKPIVSAGADADTFVEGQSASESHPFQVNSFVFGGTKYARLVKVSEESLMNVAMDLPGEILAELGASVANTFTTAITAALVTALQGNSSTFVDNGADAYEGVLNLIAAVPPRFEDQSNCFMGSRAMRLRIQNTRTTQGEPLLDPTTGTILGKRFVVNDNLTRLVYGNWAAGAFVRKSPFFLLKLIEAYHTEGAVGFKATQYLDSKFLASVSAVTTQPLYFTHLEAEGS